MAKYNLEKYTTADGLGFPLNFRRGNPNPLDNSSVWKSYEEALTYATTDPTAYVGQVLSVVDKENNTVTVYSIQDEEGTLKKVGTSPVGDESTITVAEDGTVSLYGVSGLQLTRTDEEGHSTNISYQPLLVNGKLTWIEPSSTTIEGLSTEIEGLKTRLTQIEASIGNGESGISKDVADLTAKLGNAAIDETPATGIYAELDKKANADNVYTKSDADIAIAAAVAGADHLKRTKVNSVDDIDPNADGADKFIYMVAKADGSDGDHYEEYMVMEGTVEPVGKWKVDLAEYAKTADVNTELGKKVDKADGSRLMTDNEGTKLEGIEAGAQVNKIESVDTAQFAIDGDKKLTLLEIAMGKITGLNDALTKKVDVTEDSRLMTDNEGTKLEGIEAGAQVNKIESVDTAQFAIDESKKLTLLQIAMSKITGLSDALAGKVNAVDGSRLITSSEATKLEALVLGDSGQVEISGKVNSDNVEGLAEKLDLKVDKVAGKSLIDDTLIAKVEAIEAGAQVNKIESIKVADTLLDIVEKSVNIPIATTTAAGVVKSTTEENKISVATDGTMEVNKININKVIQTEGDVLILNGGSASR